MKFLFLCRRDINMLDRRPVLCNVHLITSPKDKAIIDHLFGALNSFLSAMVEISRVGTDYKFGPLA